jgi:hypothetical protein
MTLTRVPTHRYEDPLDRIWSAAAERIGLRIVRVGDAYASTDGRGELRLAESQHLDPDDSLAQMILHELCHWLVQGEAARGERDWGLDNETPRDVPREHACLRVQATLLGRHGLRRFLGPTTDFRAFYDALPADPLAPRSDPTTTLALLALRRADAPPFAPHLTDALLATERVAGATTPFSEDSTPPALADQWALVEAPPAPHPTGLPAAPTRPGQTCGTCAWRTEPRGTCRQAGSRTRAEWSACERWEAALDCQACGACCRAAYDCVQVSRRDPVRKKHPELIVQRGPFLEVRRDGDHCSALREAPGAGGSTSYTCTIYDDRPRSCRDFERGGEHCLAARRRLGLSL